MYKIKEIRKSKGITQDELAEKLGYSRTMITKWETNKLSPTEGQLIDICSALDIPKETLIASERRLAAENKYQQSLALSNKSLTYASLEDAAYLLACLILFIINIYAPIHHFEIIISVLLSIGVIGTIIIPLLFLRNIKKAKNKTEMMKWYLKGKMPDTTIKQSIESGNLETLFNDLITKQ